MIVLINGPLGIGKSTTAWRLLERFERAAMLDGDYITALEPFDYYNQDDLDYGYKTLALLVAHHQRHGFTTVIINWIWEHPEQLQRMRAALADTGWPILAYRLVCERAELERRVRQRNRGDISWEVARAWELVQILDNAAQEGELGVVVDTTHRSTEAVVEWIWNHARGHSSPLA